MQYQGVAKAAMIESLATKLTSSTYGTTRANKGAHALDQIAGAQAQLSIPDAGCTAESQ